MTAVQTLDIAEDPVWLLDLPESAEAAPPVDTLAQELPFGQLTWQNFERLCRRLASLDGDVEYCRLYGTAGQEQGGIDIYIRRRSTAKYASWQSKRHKSFNPAKIEAAVEEFLAGEWADKSDRFVLCVQASLRSADVLNKIEESARRLRENSIEFLPLDGEELSQRLKSLPEVVFDFFGLAWVDRLCGRQAAESVTKRLTPSEFRCLKSKLFACYESHFGSVDPGVLSLLNAPPSGKKRLRLSERFVEPDLTREAEVFADEPQAVQQQAAPQSELAFGKEERPPPFSRISDQPRREKTRISLENWLINANHDIVLGHAGSGKSTLLRFIALDMLSQSPRLIALRSQFPDFLPVWVSFAFWTKLLAADKDRSSLIEAIEAWFRRQDEPDLPAFVRKAYEDKRLFMLIDGIDEWDNETAANTALGLLQSFTERHLVPAIVTSRPHGFRLITGLDGTWRVSEIAPFTIDQQIDLASTWFGHLSGAGEETAQSANRHHRQATSFVAELQHNGPMAQLAATPLLFTGLIALKQARLQLPRNRFLAYDGLTKLLLELHPTARNKAALAGTPRYPLDPTTREMALAALAYAIHTGQDGASPDSIEIDRAVNVVSRCFVQGIGLSGAEATQAARAVLTLGEEDLGILVKKSPREIGFFHRVFQEFLSSRHLTGMEFERQVVFVRDHAADPRWREVILCLLHQLQRPAEVDGLLTVIESIDGDIATAATRDLILAEATFGEFRKTPQMAGRLADKAFEQIELGRWSSVRRALAAEAIDGLSSPIVGQKILRKLRQWFPRWNSYGLTQTFQAIANWPDDPTIGPVLWRSLHDEFYGAAQAAARALAKRLGGRAEPAERLCKLIANPASIGAAAVAIEALWRGWPQHPKTEDILNAARRSDSPLIAIAGIRGRIARDEQDDDDFSFLIYLGDRDDFALNGLVNEALVAGWAGDERLRTFALREPGEERRRRGRRLRPDFGLLISGFPSDREVANLVAADFANEHPQCLFDKDDLRALAVHFKSDPTVVPALEAWVMKHRTNDAYTLSHVARVGPTPTLKAELLRCVENDHIAFWAASALVDLWGADDEEVLATLNNASVQPVDKRQNIAHVLPLVMVDRSLCRRLLLEIIASNKDRIRADFALEGLRLLGIDASDREATDCVLSRGYDEERFVRESEVREVLLTFHGDQRVVDLAKRELQREFGAIGIVAEVFSNNPAMRQLVLDAAAPIDLIMRSAILECLSKRAAYDVDSRALISAARHEDAGEIGIEASIAFAQINRDTDQLSPEYLGEIQRELEAIGPRMDARRQAALASLAAIRRLDLMPGPDGLSGIRGVELHKYRGLLRFVALEWASIAEGLGGDDQALAVLGLERGSFFDVFGNDVSSSNAMTTFALSLVEDSTKGAPAAAIRLVERVRPHSGFLRELCLSSLHYTGRTNWDSFSTAMTAGEVLGRNFASDHDLESQLIANLDRDPRDAGTIMALCEGWPASATLQMRSRFTGDPQLPIPVAFKVMSAVSPPDRLVEALIWAANELRGDLWESPAHWIPSILRRLKEDDAAYARTREVLFSQPSPGMKASFPAILARGRGLTEELRAWCRAETQRQSDILVGEVGLDLIAGQTRLVVQSLFDILSGEDASIR
jgi:NACHT domain